MNKTPETLEECYLFLEKFDDIDKWLSYPEKDAIVSAHHGIGRFIRNEWGLWAGSKLKDYFLDNGLHHPDDMSSVILTSFYRFKHNIDINLEEQIEHYVEYWLTDNEKLLRKRKQKLEKLNEE